MQWIVQATILLAWVASSCAVTFPLSRRDTRPNVLVILTDDQDARLGSMDTMDQLQSQLVQKGTTFTRHYGHVSQWYASISHSCEAKTDYHRFQLSCARHFMDWEACTQHERNLRSQQSTWWGLEADTSKRMVQKLSASLVGHQIHRYT